MHGAFYVEKMQEKVYIIYSRVVYKNKRRGWEWYM